LLSKGLEQMFALPNAPDPQEVADATCTRRSAISRRAANAGRWRRFFGCALERCTS